MSITGTLAEYVYAVGLDDFPPDVVQQAKHCVMDNVGCALGGYQTATGKMHAAVAKELGGKAESTVLGAGFRVSSLNAAHTNAQLANLLDFDDHYYYAPSLPGSPTVQSALALAEARQASFAALLTAVVVGYEVALRVGRAVGVFRRQDIPHVQVNQGFGAVAAACKVLKLGPGAIESAFGILGGSTRGTPGRKRELTASGTGATIKSNRGLYALQGVLATLQAEKGLAGPKGILDGDAFWTAAGADGCHFAELTAGLGAVYRILEIGFKPTPACRDTHPPLTAVLEVLRSHAIKPAEIERIVIKGRLRLMAYEWETMFQAMFSTPCALAMSLIGGELPGPRWYVTDRFKDPDIREFAGKVRFEADSEADALYEKGKVICTATVITKDGRRRTARIEHVKGEPENPLTEAEFRDKFRANATAVIGSEHVERVLALFDCWETLADVSVLSRLLAPRLQEAG